MSWSPSDSLVIGISTRALFQLDDEDRLYRDAGAEEFVRYQQENEEKPISPGVAFHLVKSLLDLNPKLKSERGPAIEVVIISKNHPNCSIRIKNALQSHNLPITRVGFTGGRPILDYLRSFNVGLFLSKEREAVREAIEARIPAGLVHGVPGDYRQIQDVPVIAFDCDSTLCSNESDLAYEAGKMPGFRDHESKNRVKVMGDGPLREFAMALSRLRDEHPYDRPPFRIAMITSRDFQYCERPIRTFREWGLRLDEAFFVSDMSKNVILQALKPLIFFDDNTKHCNDAAVLIPTVQIPSTVQHVLGLDPAHTNGQTSESGKFIAVCRLFLKTDFEKYEQPLLEWHAKELQPMDPLRATALLAELDRSARGTLKGKQRRSSGRDNDDFSKFKLFLENLKRKHLA